MVGSVCVVVAVVEVIFVGVAVVSLSAQQVQFLLPLSSLGLIDLTLYTDLTSGRVEEGPLTEARVSELAVHDWALVSCHSFCALGACGLLDGILYIVIHGQSHPCGSTVDFDQSEMIGQPVLLVELVQ